MRYLACTLSLLAALVVAGCGGSNSGSGVATLDSSAAAADEPATTQAGPQDPQDAILAFARCMRAEGIDIPDPDFSQGPGGGALLRLRDIDRNNPKFQKAQEKCQPHLASIRERFSPEMRQRLQDAAVEFARCMRRNGVDVPDPDLSGPGGPRGLFGSSGIDPTNPKVQKAIEACRSVFTNAGLPALRGRAEAPAPPPR